MTHLLRRFDLEFLLDVSEVQQELLDALDIEAGRVVACIFPSIIYLGVAFREILVVV